MRASPRLGALCALAGVIVACESAGPADPTIEFVKLSLTEKTVDLGMGDQQQLTISSPIPAGTAVVWRSINPGIADVSNSGVVMARSIGQTKVVAMARKSTDTALVSVHAPIGAVRVTPESLLVAVGKSAQLTTEVKDKNGQIIQTNNGSGKWSSTAPGVVSVSSTGVIQASAIGAAMITFDLSGKSATSFVRVLSAPVASITVDPPSPSVNVGRVTQLTATPKDAAGNPLSDRSVSWSSSDSTVVVVSSTGAVTGRKVGSATITASSEGAQAQTTVNANLIIVTAVAVSLNSASIQTGQTTQASAVARDAAGALVPGRSVAWSSSNTSVATISSLGLITGVGVGNSTITATIDGVGATATQTVTTATVSTVSVNLGTSNLIVGNTTQAIAVASGSLGNVITGRPVTWSSSNNGIATVSSEGVVTAVSGGQASISATVDGQVGSATVVAMMPNINSITVTVPNANLTTGQTTQATATMTDQTGATMTAPVSWSSNAPTVANVSPTGLITAVGAGSALIGATASGKSGFVTITVVAGAAPVGGNRVPLSVQRFTSGSGTVLVSTGIPLAAGMLMPGAASTVHVYVGGVEQAIYAEPLLGLHPDGSLRAILVQFNTSLTFGTPVPGEFVIGAARTIPDMAKPTASRGVPLAAALPTDPSYLVGTGLVGPTLTAQQTAALGPVYAKYDTDFAKFAEYHWGLEGATWENNYYDRALIYYSQWARTGNPVFWYRGTQIAYNYRTQYVDPNNLVPPHWSQMEGLEKHYLLTGDSDSRTTILRQANFFRYFWERFEKRGDGDIDDRIRARSIMGVLIAWRLNPTGSLVLDGYSTIPYVTLLDSAPARLLRTQNDSGRSTIDIAGVTLNYMQGMLGEALIRSYMWYKPNTQSVTWLTKSATYLWTQWNGTAGGFQYANGSFDYGTMSANTDPTADLNNFITNTFGFLYTRTGNTAYRDKAEQSFAGGVNGAWIYGSKQFNQEYAASYVHLGLRQ